MSDRPAKYETVVHASNRHVGYGIPVTVYADSVSAAKERAIAIGWNGDPRDARVTINSVHDTAPDPT